ncbi:RNA polymerase sigma factor [Ruminiclostridium josui]|uniref:RNA polymerase sigma factor n=1 Tax=Ruminiclostridium josui TaxID=1499 RepID=UPI0004657A18|nr:sigma-70 family RNA polymerase sigma factor [Ruminiclostridium josui]
MDYDKQLIEISLGNIQEFESLYNKYKKDVFAIAYSILRDTELSKDILQEVFIKLFLHLKRNSIKNVKAWLISVSRNAALDIYRKRLNEVTNFDNKVFDNIEFLSEDPLERVTMLKYLEVLDYSERQIVVLKAISGLKHREISKIVEMPLGTVLWKYRSALEKLRKNIDLSQE